MGTNGVALGWMIMVHTGWRSERETIKFATANPLVRVGANLDDPPVHRQTWDVTNEAIIVEIFGESNATKARSMTKRFHLFDRRSANPQLGITIGEVTQSYELTAVVFVDNVEVSNQKWAVWGGVNSLQTQKSSSRGGY